MAIRVLLADDQPVARAGIRAALEKAPDITVVGEAADGAAVQRLTAELRPDVVLLDLVMPGLRPVEFVRWARANCPATEVLPLTAHDRDCYLAEMLEAGAAGFLTKSGALDRLTERIRCVARGEILFDEAQQKRVNRWREEVGGRWESLTKRERQVLLALARGLDNAAVAAALCVTTKAVEHHVTNVLCKLGLASRLEAAVWVHDCLPEKLRSGLQNDLGKSPG
jgi:DNA-binding NarL/FixJ family response regulator